MHVASLSMRWWQTQGTAACLYEMLCQLDSQIAQKLAGKRDGNDAAVWAT